MEKRNVEREYSMLIQVLQPNKHLYRDRAIKLSRYYFHECNHVLPEIYKNIYNIAECYRLEYIEVVGSLADHM